LSISLEWYVKLYLHAGVSKSETKEDQTNICQCCCDPVFNESFDYQTDCNEGYLEVRHLNQIYAEQNIL